MNPKTILKNKSKTIIRSEKWGALQRHQSRYSSAITRPKDTGTENSNFPMHFIPQKAPKQQENGFLFISHHINLT